MKNKIIITAGGTSEKIDNVRKITNSSSGKLGKIIAEKLLEEKDSSIEKIYYICSKNALKPISEKIQIIEIVSTNDLQEVIERLLKEENITYFIHSMAVSDYTIDFVTNAKRLAININNNRDCDVYDLICNNTDNYNDNKISSNEDDLIIKLKKTPKIISLIKKLSPPTHLVGFKLLDGVSEHQLLDTAIKLKDKNKCDLVVANDLQHIREGVHQALIIRKNNDYIRAAGKEDIAEKLVKEMSI